MAWRIMLLLLLLAAAGLGAWIWQQNPERLTLNDAARAGSGMQFVALPEGLTAYRREGPAAAPLVILVHGYSTPSTLWDDTVPALNRAGYATLRYDLYGRGWSDRPEGDYDLARFTRQLGDLLAALEIDGPVHLVGLSMGGLIASAWTARHPASVDRLVLIAPFNTPVRVRPLEWPLIGELLAHSLYFPRQRAMQKANFIDPVHFERYAAGFETQLAYRGFRRAIHSTLRHLIRHDPLPVYQALGRQQRAVALIWGEQDQVVPLSQADRVLAALGPGATLHRIAGAGHLPQADRPEQTHAALIEALAAPELRDAAGAAGAGAAAASAGPRN
jgi:pimeloyl-ACP methyl ester carboxylesterase